MVSKDRFATDLTKDDIMQAIHSQISKKTCRQQNGHMVFKTRNISNKLTHMTASRMDELLAQFIMEARRQDIEVYPPKTLLLYNAI